MICTDCTRGVHCGPPGRASASCPCQHRPRRDGDPVAVSGPGGTPVDAGPPAEADGPSVDGTQPFTAVLAEWMRHHRAGRWTEAATLRRVLIARLGRLGADHAVGGMDRE